MIWAIASLAFFQLGELLVETAESYNPTTNLSWGDVGVNDMSQLSMVKVHLRRSKCDQFGKGVDVIVGRYRTPIRPVVAMTAYVSLRQDHPGAFITSRRATPVPKGWFVQ